MKLFTLLFCLLASQFARGGILTPEDPRYSPCNICGCPNCYYYANLATVWYDYNGTRRHTNCETLQAWASNKWIFDPSYCPQLVLESYDVCACSFPNGTMVADAWDGRVESFALELPQGYDKYYDQRGNPLVVEQLTEDGRLPDGRLPGYTTSEEAEKLLEKVPVPDAKYFGAKPGFYEAYTQGRGEGAGSSSMSVAFLLGSLWILSTFFL